MSRLNELLLKKFEKGITALNEEELKELFELYGEDQFDKGFEQGLSVGQGYNRDY